MRLAARLTGWDIDILTPDEYNEGIEKLASCVKSVTGADDTLVDKLIALGIISVLDLDDVGPEPLVKELQVDEELANNLVAAAAEQARLLAAEAKQTQAEAAMQKETETAPPPQSESDDF